MRGPCTFCGLYAHRDCQTEAASKACVAERIQSARDVTPIGEVAKLRRIQFHSQPALRERFYAVVDDLPQANCIVDLWLHDIAWVLGEHGYEMTVRRVATLDDQRRRILNAVVERREDLEVEAIMAMTDDEIRQDIIDNPNDDRDPDEAMARLQEMRAKVLAQHEAPKAKRTYGPGITYFVREYQMLAVLAGGGHSTLMLGSAIGLRHTSPGFKSAHGYLNRHGFIDYVRSAWRLLPKGQAYLDKHPMDLP